MTDEEDVRPWWKPGGSGGSWRCGRRHPVYGGDTCKRVRFHTGQHLHPDTGYWLPDEDEDDA